MADNSTTQTTTSWEFNATTVAFPESSSTNLTSTSFSDADYLTDTTTSETTTSVNEILSTAISSTSTSAISSTSAATAIVTSSGSTIETTTASGVGSETMAIITGAAIGGTVFLVIIIILICCCCRACRRKSNPSKDKLPDEPRQGPEGGSMPYPPKENSQRKPASPGYATNPPYFVDIGPSDGGYSGTIVHDSDPRQGLRPSTEGQFSLPRPSLVSPPGHSPSRKDTLENGPSSPTRNYSTTAEPQHSYSQSSRDFYQNTPTYHADEGKTLHPEHKTTQERQYSSDSKLKTRDTSPEQKAGKYIRHRDEQLQRKNRDASGKYVTNISRYQGSTYDKAEDFTHQLQPVSTHMEPPTQPSEKRRYESPNRKASESETSPGKPSKQPQSPVPKQVQAPAVLPKTKLNKVPRSPEKHEDPQPSENELANNPVFSKRKMVIDEVCKTIRLKDDREVYTDTLPSPTTAQFTKADPATGEDEDPYWRIRESKINLNQNIPLMNIIPQGDRNNRPVSVVSEDYDDVSPTHPGHVADQEEEYTDTVLTNRHDTQEVYVNQTHADHGHATSQEEYVNVSSPHVTANTQELYANASATQQHYPGQEDYVNISSGIHNILRQESMQNQQQSSDAGRVDSNNVTDTARKRLLSMRASMPPDALSEAVDQLFDDAIAGSELDLSQHPTGTGPAANPAPQSQGASVPPVLKRKTKMEESKEEKNDRDSWRISRSSFYDEIGANEVPAPLTQPSHINASMVKKGMALSDMNKPFNYMGPR